MAYCFKRNQSLSKAARRLGRERIEHAIECLKDSDRAEGVHCARKEIKKTHAVLRLVRARIPKKQFRRLTAILRKASTRLAPLRDACIRAQTLRSLAARFRRQLAPGAFRYTQATLRKSIAREMRRFVSEKTADTVEKILRREMKGFKRLQVGGNGWDALGPGVKAAYRKGRRAYRIVERGSSPENFHAWRKHAKNLWYHARLLHPAWPEQMEAIASELEALGEILGEDHDLAVLKQGVEARLIGCGHEQELEALNALIEERQCELRAAALALGVRFYAERPSVFCDRLAGYWKIWRREKNPSLSSRAQGHELSPTNARKTKCT